METRKREKEGGRGKPGVLEWVGQKEGRRQGGRKGVIGSWRLKRGQGSQRFWRLGHGRGLGLGSVLGSKRSASVTIHAGSDLGCETSAIGKGHGHSSQKPRHDRVLTICPSTCRNALGSWRMLRSRVPVVTI